MGAQGNKRIRNWPPEAVFVHPPAPTGLWRSFIRGASFALSFPPPKRGFDLRPRFYETIGAGRNLINAVENNDPNNRRENDRMRALPLFNPYYLIDKPGPLAARRDDVQLCSGNVRQERPAWPTVLQDESREPGQDRPSGPD